MKTKLILLIAIVTSLASLNLRAQVGTATLNATGNWSDSTKWTSTPSGFAPVNGNNGRDWNATVNANTVTVDAATIIQTLTFGGGNVTTSSTLTINNGLLMSGGNTAGSNAFGGSGTADISGASTWSGGVFNGLGGITNFNAGTLTITANGQNLEQRTVNIYNAATIADGAIDVYNGGTLNIGSGGSLTAGNTSTLTFGTGSGTIKVSSGGTFTQSGAGTTIFTGGDVFDNAGTVNVNAGMMRADSGGTSTGLFSFGSGAVFRVAGGSYTMNAGYQINGAGTFDVNAGTATFTGSSTSNTGNLSVSGTGVLSVAGTFTTTGGLNMSGSIGTGTLFDGAGTVTFGGASTWAGAEFRGSGVTNFNGALAITANGQNIQQRTVNLNGAGSTIGNGIIEVYGGNGGTLNIGNGGVLTASNTSTLTFTGSGTIKVSSGGTFTQSGAGTTIFTGGDVFDNAGTVNVNAGVMRAESGGTSTGLFDISSGAVFRVGGGTYTMSAATVNGAGTFDVNAGTAIFNGSSTSNTGNLSVSGTGVLSIAGTFTTTGGLNMSGSTGTGTLFDGAGTVTLGGASTWTGAEFRGSGVTNFNGALAITANGQNIQQRTVNLNGAGSTIGNGIIEVYGGNGGKLNIGSGGTLTATNTSSLTFAGSGGGGAVTVSSGGTFTQSGVGTTTFNGGVVFDNAGTVNVTAGTMSMDSGVTQHSGTTLTGGTWNVSGGGTLTFSTGSNLTTIGSAASVSLDGATSTFNRIPTTASTLTTNQGSFTLKNDRDITTANAFTNSGTVTVQDSTTTFKIGATGNQTYTQTGASSFTVLAGGAMIDSSAFNLNGGTLAGTGTIDAPLTTSGTTTIAPGSSPGQLNIVGSTVLGSGNTLAIEVGGLTQGTLYDYLNVTGGTLTLGGLLDVDFINGFENSVIYTDAFYVATAPSAILGGFSNVASGSRIGTNTPMSFVVWYGALSPYGANNLVLTGAPEPSRALLMLLGILGIATRRRRR